MKKIMIVVLAMLALTIGAYAQSAPQLPEDKLSSDFKENAWRAIDAFWRIPRWLSPDTVDTTDKKLLIEADKAVDEAKYKASTPLDKTVFHLLELALISQKHLLDYRMLNPLWSQTLGRFLQCDIEAESYIMPDILTEQGMVQAQVHSCTNDAGDWSGNPTRWTTWIGQVTYEARKGN